MAEDKKLDLSNLPDAVIRELAPARVRRAAERERQKTNEMLVLRITGISATTDDSDVDPCNPNNRSAGETES